MKSSARNVKLTSVDDLFSTEESRQEATLEKVRSIALSELHPFPGHPFAVRDDDSMKETVESVKEYGVLVPAIARPREDGGYELVSGHRRKHACELAGLETMPIIVRDMDRDTAIIILWIKILWCISSHKFLERLCSSNSSELSHAISHNFLEKLREMV